MSFPLSPPTTTDVVRPAVSSHTILLLCGVLFGMCISGSLPPETKTWFVFAGTIGLVAYLGLGVAARAHLESQQRVAAIHAEERLDRHAHFDVHFDQPSTSA